MFPPPAGQAPTGQQNPALLMGFGDLHMYSIVDQLQLPSGLEPGDYVLGFRCGIDACAADLSSQPAPPLLLQHNHNAVDLLCVDAAQMGHGAVRTSVELLLERENCRVAWHYVYSY